ncbi:MAG: phosphatidylserine decarboxylase family protein [Deltaproteobacteria bacterium]|nr:phosphatidylserine decarboxylase family protein [Deltaproteobacteria bacterium]
MDHDSIIAREGLPFIVPLVIFTIGFAFFNIFWLASLFFIATAFVTWFFRNPQRKVPDDANAIISPADGEIIKIEGVLEGDYLKGPSKKISIFMNVFNVHVNRIPYSGTVESIHYNKGDFFSASLDKASLHNEKNSIIIKTDDGKKILTVQIAGLIARRIECWIKEGMYVNKGERFGLIRFGSRLEVFLPSDSITSVKVGDKVKAGETLIGWLK